MQLTPLIKVLLYPLSLIYGVVVYVRNRLFDTGILPSREFNLPVISVGNLTAGGTGKTPVTEYLIELLKDNFTVAVISRGYKRKSRGFVLAGEYFTPAEIGDEPCQMKRKFPEAVVAVCNSRVSGIRKLLKIHPETDVILLDDAFQHRYVKPGLSILLIDFNNPVTKDLLLPAGMLREPASERKRAEIILVTKCPEKLKPIERRIMVKELDLYPFQQLYFTTIQYESLIPVFPSGKPPDIEKLKETKADILLLTGIANPRPLKKYARSISTRIHNLTYPDHHQYTFNDILHIEETFNSIDSGSKIILTTEKDAVRLRQTEAMPGTLKTCIFFVPIRVSFLNDESKLFNNAVLNYVRSNKKNSILFKGQNSM